MDILKPLSSEHRVSIATAIVLSFLTCGIYNIYWNGLQFDAMNRLLGREEFKWGWWLVLSLLTCGLFHIYYEYKMGRELANYLRQTGRGNKDALPIIGLALSFCGMTVIADAVYQMELNELVA